MKVRLMSKMSGGISDLGLSLDFSGISGLMFESHATTKHGKIVDMRPELAVKSMGEPNQICVPMNWL